MSNNKLVGFLHTTTPQRFPAIVSHGELLAGQGTYIKSRKQYINRGVFMRALLTCHIDNPIVCSTILSDKDDQGIHILFDANIIHDKKFFFLIIHSIY